MRTSEHITQNEIKAYAKFCAERGVIHDGSQDDQHNADFVLNYFENTWKQDITEENLEAAWDKIRPHLKLYAPNQQEANDLIYKLSAEEQKVLAEWKGPRGLKPTHRAVAALLSWLAAHKFSVTKQNLDLAVGQQRIAPFLEWDESATPRYENPRQHQDDGAGFPGKAVNEPRWKRVQREREEREAAEAKSGAAAWVRSRAATEAREKAESLQGSTHAETDQLKKIFVTSGTEIDWQATLASRLQMQAQFDKQRAVRRFIR